MLHRAFPLPLLAALALLASAAAGNAPESEPEAQAPPAVEAPPAPQPPATPVAPPAAAPPPRVSLFHRRPHGTQPAWVAAANPLAVDAGLEILGKGGNAIDAAVAVRAMLGLVEPQSSGIAGGAFLLYYDAHTHKVSAVDGRERAPAGAQPDMFLDEHGKPLPFVEAVRSGRSTGVPGAIAMLYAAHAKLGALRWKELFQPAIRAASLGFKVPARLALFLGEGSPFPPTNEVRTLFARPDGDTIQEGDLFRNPEYAQTLERIALDGPRALYEGAIANEIVATTHQGPFPGTLTLRDLTCIARSGPNRCAGPTAGTRCACRRRPRAACVCWKCSPYSTAPISPGATPRTLRPGSCSRRRVVSYTPTATATSPIRASCRCRWSAYSIPPTYGCACS